MSSITPWDADKFREDIGFLITNFNSLFLSDVIELLSNPNGDRKNSMKALASLDVASVQRRLHELIYKIEEELRNNALVCLSEQGFSPDESKLFLAEQLCSDSIKSNIIDELNSTLNQLKDLSILARTHLHVLETNSGVGGFFRGLFKGYTNPVDGVSHSFGQGTMQLEVDSSMRTLTHQRLWLGNLLMPFRILYNR